MTRYRAGSVVVEPAAAGADCQDPGEIRRIGAQRDVEDRQFVPGPRLDAGQQVDVPLDAGDEDALARIGEAQLLQRADAVGVTVEDVIELHRAYLSNRARRIRARSPA